MSDFIFMDASAWIAIVNPKDPRREEAWPAWRSILENAWRLLTTNWSLYEALAVLRRRGGSQLSQELWHLSRPERGLVDVIRVSSDIEEAAVRTFLQHEDKTWSVMDCASFHTIREEKCRRAFAYDIHFRQASGEFGFELLE